MSTLNALKRYAGILWMLFVTGTTLSVPSEMGAIMCVGVATANSILMVTFANDERAVIDADGGRTVGGEGELERLFGI